MRLNYWGFQKKMLGLQTDMQKYQRQNFSEEDPLIALVMAAKQGNREAFEQLFDLFQKKVFRMVYYRTRSHQDAEDLTQEIFIKVYKKLSGLKNTSRFRPWLFSMVINRVRDFHRKNRILKFFSISPVEDDGLADPGAANCDCQVPVQNLMKQDFWRQVAKFLDILSKMEREIFLLRFFDQFTITEISQFLEKSESTVKTHLYRALVKFKKASSILQQLREQDRE